MRESRTSEKSRLDWIVLGLLAALVVANALLLALRRAAGPLVGLLVYGGLLWRWERGDCWAAFVGSLIGMTVHVLRVGTIGFSQVALLDALNLFLPTVLAPLTWAKCQGERRDAQDKAD